MLEKKNKYDFTFEAHTSLNKKKDEIIREISKIECFLGLDGYIDSLYSMVKIRKSKSDWVRMESMREYGERVLSAAGSSTSIERVLKSRTHGGFAPNTCGALNALGVRVYLVAACGYPQVHNIFLPLGSNKNTEIISYVDPGDTIALEFNDGKIMMQDFTNIFKISWNLIKERVSIERLAEILEKVNIMGFGHWSLIPELSNIWKHVQEEVFPTLSQLRKKLFFVDLADIKKRTREDILEMLTILKKINEDVPVVLSLNDQECLDIYRALKIERTGQINKESGGDLPIITKEINNKLNLSYLVTHTPHFAVMACYQELYWVTEGFTSAPRFMTGAGDHFNAGLIAGLACGLDEAESLLMGNALTAIFVRTGFSPNIDALFEFIRRYLNYIRLDNPNFP